MPPPPHQVASRVPTRTMKGMRCPPVTMSSEVLTFLWATTRPKIMSASRYAPIAMIYAIAFSLLLHYKV